METLGPLSETLDTEVKGWLDLNDPRHAAIIARACIALRNNGGGRLVLGIDDKTLRSLDENRPPDVLTAYHADTLNKVVGQFASPKFEVRVQVKEYEEHGHPEITVSGGVDFPVISRAPFEKVLRQNAVYVRTVSNGRPSSCEPLTPQDWERLIQVCFDNREADIGRFFRRHLPDIVAQLQGSGAFATAPTTIKQPSQAVQEFLELGRVQFEKRWKEKKTVAEDLPTPFQGFFEAAAIISGDYTAPLLKDLLDKLFIHQPHMTGWPTWVDSRGFRNSSAHPYVRQGAWEALIDSTRGMVPENSLDFWRIEPQGRFYLLRTLQDDTVASLRERGVKPGTVLDFFLLIARTAEAIGTVRAFARGFAVKGENAVVDFAFRWTGLRGRELCCWVEPGRSLLESIVAEDDIVTTTCRVSLDAPDSVLWHSVKEAVQPVFDVFGAGLGGQVIQDIVDRTVTRRL